MEYLGTQRQKRGKQEGHIDNGAGWWHRHTYVWEDPEIGVAAVCLSVLAPNHVTDLTARGGRGDLLISRNSMIGNRLFPSQSRSTAWERK